MKKFLRASIALFCVLFLVPQNIFAANVRVVTPEERPAVTQAFTAITGKKMISEIMLGINIGNTLEARSDGNSDTLESETSWGEARIMPEHFKAIARKGYTSVRIPVTWGNHMDSNLKIDAKWMNRVEECVKYALDAGLFVIINAHHERRFYDKLDSGKMAEAEKELNAIWSQVSARFKGYSEKLMFEVMNEPHRSVQGGWVWDSWNAQGIGHVDRELCDKVNLMNASALSTIRKSGGNNEKRVVVLAVPGASPDAVEFFESQNDDYTMLGIFIYPGEKQTSANFKSSVDRDVQRVAASKIPVFIKEINPGGDYDDSFRLEWTKYAFSELAKQGIPTFWWNCGNPETDPVLLDRFQCRWPNKNLLNAVFDAYGKESGADFIMAQPTAFPYEVPGPYTSSENGFTFWTPPVVVRELATSVVVEYSEAFTTTYSFSNHHPTDWVQFDTGHKRLTDTGSSVILDTTGLEGQSFGFALWWTGEVEKIKRIYSDIAFDGTETEEILDSLRFCITNRLLPSAQLKNFGAKITRADFAALIVPTLEKKMGEIDTKGVTLKDSTLIDVRKCVKAGVFAVENGNVQPGEQLTRKDAAQLLKDAAQILEARNFTVPFTPDAEILSRGECIKAVEALFLSICDE
ncbi:MAG: glycoside hydrolase family 5 protein [Clostridiales bacterium]|nr:glycoside hydrolase family 5 protein [Clostridiales bacterium]